MSAETFVECTTKARTRRHHDLLELAPRSCAVAILTGVAAGIGVAIGLSAYAVVWAVGRVWGVR